MNRVLLAAKPVINLYSSPSPETEVTTQIRYGWAAHVLSQEDEWVYLRTHDLYEAWAVLENFVADAEAESESEIEIESDRPHLLQITALSANLYLDPDVKSRAPILNLPFESRLKFDKAEDDDWLRVHLLDGQAAFVRRGDASPVPAPIPLFQALQQATRFLGITYTWGGTSAYGFDCSGFIQMIFRQAGVNLPRDAQAQCRWAGFAVTSRETLQSGDVLFFSETHSEDHINHVAVYLGGADGRPSRFLHSTMTGPSPGIQFSYLDEEPWRTRLTACRRLKSAWTKASVL